MVREPVASAAGLKIGPLASTTPCKIYYRESEIDTPPPDRESHPRIVREENRARKEG